MKRLALGTTIVVATLVGLLMLWQLLEAVLIFLLSLALAAAMRPVVDRVAERGLPRSLALALAYVMVVCAVVGMFVVAGGQFVAEVQLAADDLVRAYEHVTTTWPELSDPVRRSIGRRLLPPDKLYAALTDGRGHEVFQGAVGVTFGVFGALVNLVVVVVISIYWSVDRIHFERLWLSLLPADERAWTRDLWRNVEDEVGSYLRSEVAQAVCAAWLLGAGYWLIGLRFPALAALVAGLAWLLPWVGVFFAVAGVVVLIAPAAVLDTSGTWWLTAAPAILYTVAVLLLMEWLVEPKLFNRRRYNGLLVAVVVLAMAEQLGLAGMLLGPPTAAAIQILLSRLAYGARTVSQAIEPASLVTVEDRLAAVRRAFEAQEAPAPELANLFTRLEVLATEVAQLAPDIDLPPPRLSVPELGQPSIPISIGEGRGNAK
ncbi:MAG: AI-2E family transporter [Pirellulales bacterium]|nr:AI-2E family transporter [Pirellulales bacterium]